MTFSVVIRSGPNLNQTLSTILFDQFGQPTNQEVFVCADWFEGFNWATQHGYDLVLFVDSGTLFTDWPSWCSLIDRYPHAGLVAHLIWYPDTQLYLHEQCWLMNVTQFDQQDFLAKSVQHPVAVRSEQNLHDDYTPLWVCPTDVLQSEYATTHFGQGIIARQLNRQQGLVNWNNSARQIKSFLYDCAIDLSQFQQYKDVAENQLWIFNNEPMAIVKKSRLVSPGSGLSWMLNITDPATTHLQIVDISRVQVLFNQELWYHWNGTDYGTFVWDFIIQHQVVHYQFDATDLTPLEKLKLKNKNRFVQYVNDIFVQLVPPDFAAQWQQARQTKSIEFCVDNLITWVLDNDINSYDHIWKSNILNYKWTLLHTTAEQYKQFQLKTQ
jgi:hypothetical protein